MRRRVTCSVINENWFIVMAKRASSWQGNIFHLSHKHSLQGHPIHIANCSDYIKQQIAGGAHIYLTQLFLLLPPTKLEKEKGQTGR